MRALLLYPQFPKSFWSFDKTIKLIGRKVTVPPWRQSIKRNTRFQFWSQIFGILKHNPRVLISYITMCVLSEHHIDYRQIVQNEIKGQLADYRIVNFKEEFQQVAVN